MPFIEKIKALPALVKGKGNALGIRIKAHRKPIGMGALGILAISLSALGMLHFGAESEPVKTTSANVYAMQESADQTPSDTATVTAKISGFSASMQINSAESQSAVTTAPTTTREPAQTTTKTTTKTTSASTKKTTAETKATEKKKSYDSKEEARLESVTVKPDRFLDGEEEEILTKYLDKIITDDMSNYEKALACYDYLIENTYYDYGGWSAKIKSVLEYGFGTCTEYSYVYMAMMRYIGFDATTVSGLTSMSGGGYGEHTWVEVTLDGTVYVFDPQVDDNMSGSSISHARFCKNYDEVSENYIKE